MDTYEIKHSIKTHLELGRVSNIFTVFSNVTLGYLLSGVNFEIALFIALSLAGMLFYLAGMYFNDYSDRDWDKKQKNDRPIVTGQIKEKTVLSYSMIYFGVGLLLFSFVAVSQVGYLGLIAPLLLVLTIVIYDLWHKGNPFSPIVMGLCRALLILSVSSSLNLSLELSHLVYAISYVLYTSALTYVAKFEHTDAGGLKKFFRFLLFMPYLLIGLLTQANIFVFVSALWSIYILWNFSNRSIGNSVTDLIAGMILLDSIYFASIKYEYGALGLLFFLMTLKFQKLIKGT